MESSARVTLALLVSLKARRERKLRAALLALTRQEDALLGELETLARERFELHKKWRDRCEIEDVLEQDALRDLRIELGDYYLTEQRFADRLDALKRHLDEVKVEKERQNRLLQKAVIAQEKFKTLLE
jgi:hypothetical protein